MMLNNLFSKIVSVSLQYKILTLLLASIIAILGLFVAKHTTVDVLPNLNKPTITLMTEAGGKSALEVEQQITNVIQTQLNGLNGLSSIRSTSTLGLSVIYLNFEYGQDIYQLRQIVTERLMMLKNQLPNDVQPSLAPISSIMGEVMLIALPINDTPDLDSMENSMQAREYADFVVRPRLLSIKGVAQITPIGGLVRQYRITPNLNALSNAGISLENLKQQLSYFGKSGSAGFLTIDNKEWVIQNLAKQDLYSLKNTPIQIANNQTMPLYALADVFFAPKIKRGDAMFNGKPAVIIGVQKQPDADTLTLTTQLEAAIKELSDNKPNMIDTPVITFKQADFINKSINNLSHKLINAAGIVAVIVWLFLGNFRSTVVTLTALPLSILITFLCFKQFGLSINTMTLGGLAISIGELVDDAVVDLENITRRYKLAKKTNEFFTPTALIKLIQSACLEVRGSVLYATLIIIIVFLPLLFLPNMEGKLFTPLGIAYIVSILSSLFVAMTVTPVLSYYIVPKIKCEHPKYLTGLQNIYASILEKCFNKIKLLTTTLILILIAAIIGIVFIPKSFLPTFNEGSILLDFRMQPGTALSANVETVNSIQQKLLKITGIEYIGVRSGRAELDEHAEGVHVSEFDVKIKEDIPYIQTQKIFSDIRGVFEDYDGSMTIGQPISHRIDHLLSGVRSPIAIKIFGANTDILKEQALQLQNKLKSIPGIVEVNLEKQRNVPHIFITIKSQADTYGISEAHLFKQIQDLLNGDNINQIINNQNSKQTFSMVLKIDTKDINDLNNMMIETPKGLIALQQLANINFGESINQIQQENGQRRIIISANIDENQSSLSTVANNVQHIIDTHSLPTGYFIKFEGQHQAKNQASYTIGGLAFLALLGVVGILYHLYKNWLWVALTMSNIPFAMLGAVALLYITSTPLSIAAMVGFITLAGISSRNGILKISHYLTMIEEGMTFNQGLIIQGAKDRLSPVLMTALTASLALLPVLLQKYQAGSEILYPVAVVIIGGLLTSTLIDSFMTPLWFYHIFKKSKI
ncbi:MAG: cation efflux system protein resistance-nodulation-division family [Pseudomonadota bacterium]